jgi:two-component system LytT family response regulator
MRAIVVDDETKARENLRMLFDSLDVAVHIIGEAGNITEAKTLIDRLQPDVVFLDIAMPGGNGFQLFEHLNYRSFHTVFVTAYEEFAIKAFEVSAIDYLLKPIDLDRLAQCIQKVTVKNNQEQLLSSLKENLRSQSISQLSIPYSSGYKVIDVADIIFFKAEEAYTKICVQSKRTKMEYLYAKHLNYFDNLFDDQTLFFRTHRSWMINIKFITKFDKLNNAVVIDDFSIPVSRRRMKNFQLLFS